MRILTLALGTRGDLELFLALGRALNRRGHDVVVGTSGFYAGAVRESGLEFGPIGQGRAERMQAVLRGLRERPDIVGRTLAYYRQWLAPELEAGRAALLRLAGQADYFISNLKMVLARGDGVMPGASVTYDPPADLADLARYGTQAHRGAILDMVALSRPLIDAVNAWEPHYQFTGFWQAGVARTWRPSAALQAVFDEGEPPVVLTMGSMLGVDLGPLVDRFGRALLQSGRRGVVVLGWAEPPAVDPALPVRLVREAPYDWLFERSCAVVHTGSYGATAAALRAGKMSVVLPQLKAQELMGHALQRAGAAAGVFDLERLTTADLADAIAHATTSAGAERWRDLVAGDPGVEGAADLIEAHACQRGGRRAEAYHG